MKGKDTVVSQKRTSSSKRHLKASVAKDPGRNFEPFGPFGGAPGKIVVSSARQPPCRLGEAPPSICRDLRAAALSRASCAPRRVVATAEDGLSAPRVTLASWGGANVSRDICLRGDAAGYIRRPRRPRPGLTKDPPPGGNQARGVGDLTTNMRHTTTLPGGVPYPDPSSLG